MTRLVAEILLVYKRCISPLLPRSCLYSPTCSEFMRLAIVEHGLIAGMVLGIWRLLRCQPFCAGGIDIP